MELEEARRIVATAAEHDSETFVAAYLIVQEHDIRIGGGDPCATSTALDGRPVAVDDEQDDFTVDD